MAPQLTVKPEISKEYIDNAKRIFSLAEIRASPESISTVATCLSKYKGASIKGVGETLERIARDTNSERFVSDVAKCLSSDTVVRCISRFERIPGAIKEIASQLGYIAYYTKSGKAVSDTAACISRFERSPEAARNILYWLRVTASETESGNAVSNTTACISRFEKTPEAAENIASYLGKIAYNGKSEKAVSEAVKKINQAKTPEEAVKLANNPY
jgi:hypothetical protein